MKPPEQTGYPAPRPRQASQADAAGVGCYTETFGDGTEALYRGLGFEVRERLEIVPGAPMARTMWRDHRPSEPVTDEA